MAKRNKCMVTILIGDYFKDFWRRHSRQTWLEYAERQEYDIVIIDDYIDDSEFGKSRQPHWQKCLTLEHERVKAYDHVVWVDADILINFHTALCVKTAWHNSYFLHFTASILRKFVPLVVPDRHWFDARQWIHANMPEREAK